MQKSNINVGVRIRPPLPREIKDKTFQKCVGSVGQRIYLSLSGKPVLIKENDEQIEGVSTFQFDRVYEMDSQTEDVYTQLIKPSVAAVAKKGINATVFAYGQTGSGKTYTMQANKDSII